MTLRKLFANLSINYVFSFSLSFLLLFQIVLVYFFPFFPGTGNIKQNLVIVIFLCFICLCDRDYDRKKNQKTDVSFHYKLHLILPYCCISILTIYQCVFFLFAFVSLFVLSLFLRSFLLMLSLSFLVNFYCLYMLKKAPFLYSICLTFLGFVLNYISHGILRSFSQHLLFYIN